MATRVLPPKLAPEHLLILEDIQQVVDMLKDPERGNKEHLLGSAADLIRYAYLEDANKFIRYDHHGQEVAVREDLKGRHRDFCLCFSCRKFNIKAAPEDKCHIANMLYALCLLTGIAAPVWECPEFIWENDPQL